MSRSGYYTLATVIWAITIAVLSLIPIREVSDYTFFHFKYLDKVVHFVFYLVLTYLIYYTWKETGSNQQKEWQQFGLIFIIALLYGLLMEILQGFTGYRDPDVFDMLANGVGSIGGIFAVYLKERIFQP